MFLIEARNPNEALFKASLLFPVEGKSHPSRNGPVLELPRALSTFIRRPWERVNVSGVRNANHTFHLMESLWMLAGRNDVKFPGEFVKQIKQYTDDGQYLWGAYGHRWRSFFGYDQLPLIIKDLQHNPASRRNVLQMWNAASADGLPSVGRDGVFCNADLGVAANGGKDVPCNTAIYFDTRDGRLNMTVSNRSNDIVWGLYGANCVHMSMLQEYMALSIGVPMGWMNTVSHNAHVYTDVYPVEALKEIGRHSWLVDCYLDGVVESLPLIHKGETMVEWDADLTAFFTHYDQGGLEACMGEDYLTDYFMRVVRPMLHSWLLRKGDTNRAKRIADSIAAPDWAWAQREWLRNLGKAK